MKRVKELKTKFSKMISSSLPSSAFNEAGEAVSTLFVNDWVRILVIRTQGSSDVTIEVESSLPRYVVGQNDNLAAEDLLNGAIHHLYYLKELGSIGFTLDVIREDCLWTASKTFTEGLEATVFQKLCPPDCLENAG